jgi:pentose-5-phosphate-3-epimerase/putative flippase GtrA
MTTLPALRRLSTHTRLGFLVYRYRYLVTFTAIGFGSILLELALVSAVLPTDWPWPLKAGAGFLAGLAVSFWLNARVNFDVPREHLRATFLRFAAVSGLSFGLNMLAVAGATEIVPTAYGPARLGSAGVLFLVAYTLHRRWTFDTARDFGVAVYAARGEDTDAVFARLGRNCDHVHIDLVDATFASATRPVDLSKFANVKRLWPDLPVCVHLMTRTPTAWLPKVWDAVDWVLVHVEGDDDLAGVIADCRLRGKKVGVVWHPATGPLSAVLPWLPHVDFAAVLGIPEPGRSGQRVMDGAIAGTEALDRLRNKYGYEVLFDGGVNPTTVKRVRARYVVAASAVLTADNPVRIASTLRTGARYDRRAA